MPSFDNLAIAYRRCTHFVPQADLTHGPFTALSTPSARNYAMLLDAKDESDELGDLCLLNSWAQSINRRCDTERVSGNDKTIAEMASFLSRMTINPTLLAKGSRV